MIKLSKLFKTAAKAPLKPVLQKMYIKNQKAYTTDGYSMMIVPINVKGEGFLSESNVKLAEATQKITKSKADPIYKLEVFPETYPNVDVFLDGVKALKLEEPTMILTRKSLMNVLDAMQEDSNFDKVEMYFVAKDQPLVFKNRNATGVIMPCSK